jgi:CMP-N-acetylneuraminic acid synthetase
MNPVPALIIARQESERLPRKNIKEFCGKPLLAWSIEAAKQSKYVSHVFVVTDGKEVADVAGKYGADVIWQRPDFSHYKKLAGSVAFMYGVLEAEKILEYDTFITLLPTSPLKTAQDIDNAYDTYQVRGNRMTVSVSKLNEIIVVKDVGYCTGKAMFYDCEDKYFRYNGAISIVQKWFYKTGFNAGLLNGHGNMREDILSGMANVSELIDHSWGSSVIGLYVMPAWTQYDIDDIETWEICEYWFKKKILLEG